MYRSVWYFHSVSEQHSTQQVSVSGSFAKDVNDITHRFPENFSLFLDSSESKKYRQSI